MKTDETIF